VADAGGGLCFALGGEVKAVLPLPVAGLLSDRPLEEVCAGLSGLRKAVRAEGGSLDAPFAALSFLALPVIPELRLTDLGLVDVMKQEVIG
jgi:adenine deaminase